jgi:hypothetical protein
MCVTVINRDQSLVNLRLLIILATFTHVYEGNEVAAECGIIFVQPSCW